MDRDFLVELEVPDGVKCLEPFLSKAPVDLAVGKQEGIDADVLVQTTVSRVAGFFCESERGELQVYCVSVHEAHPGEPENVVRQLSAIFREADVSHKVFRIIYELDENEEVLAYRART